MKFLPLWNAGDFFDGVTGNLLREIPCGLLVCGNTKTVAGCS